MFTTEWMGRAWRGQERLGIVFWKNGFVYPLHYLMYIGLGIGLKALTIEFKLTQFSHEFTSWCITLIWLLSPYWIWWACTVWKCRKNAEIKFWKYPAIIAASIILVGASILTYGGIMDMFFW
jgi:hypothetical protein